MGKAGLVVVVGAFLVMALLAVFALELANAQAKSKSDVEVQVHDRAVLAGALIDSLFQTVVQQIPQDSLQYGGPTVPTKRLESVVGQNLYLAVVGSGPGHPVVAATTGFTGQARSDLAISAALKLVDSGVPYGLGNLLPYGKTGVINFAVAFPTRYGSRVLLTGLDPRGTLTAFITSELKTIPGVTGSNNYLIDGNGVVLASTNAKVPVGHVISAPAAEALEKTGADYHGTYLSQVALTNSTWRIVLASPDGPLFASVTGIRQLVPWLIFSAFALVAFFTLLLGWRVIRSARELEGVNAQLAKANADLVDANHSLERRAAELARSNEELDQFASIASHDLQEPLRKVRTFTEQLVVMEGDRVSDKGRDYLIRANASAERMQRLIEDLLKFSRVSTQGRPFVPVDLAEITRGVLSDLEAPIQESGAIVRVGPLPTVLADPLQMHQLILNLLSNALKFRRAGVVPEVEIDATLEGDSVLLAVRDNGIGFEPRYSQRIFRVFERLHPREAYAGTGIGLALCRKIADRHGGTIVADGTLGVGSTFTVTLPLRRHRSQELPSAGSPSAGSPSPGSTDHDWRLELNEVHVDA